MTREFLVLIAPDVELYVYPPFKHRSDLILQATPFSNLNYFRLLSCHTI